LLEPQQFLRQTDGLRLVVSSRAVFDGDLDCHNARRLGRPGGIVKERGEAQSSKFKAQQKLQTQRSKQTGRARLGGSSPHRLQFLPTTWVTTQDWGGLA
jgi:hypothetical protein